MKSPAKSKDVLGRVYEYFLGKFASVEAKVLIFGFPNLWEFPSLDEPPDQQRYTLSREREPNRDCPLLQGHRRGRLSQPP